jgi:homopolymeric O-antigen transport system ATP-binding protein
MSHIAIRTENLGKLYLKGQRRQLTNFRQNLTEGVRERFRTLASAVKRRPEIADTPAQNRSVWALRHVSIEIKRGDVVGVVGDNGGGKTSLLRILSRITYPTEGLAEVHGRVGTLLDVGAGFHAELTGRENIYLNGTLSGMTRIEIGHKFDEVVAFAELEKFVDTPLKHYSSGMCARLAFAVAVNLESAILLVDEILALADARFQTKCLTRMAAAGGEGRTVLFVSHDLEFVRRLCRHAIVLAGGRVVCFAPASEAVDYYRFISNTRHRCGPSNIEEVLEEI